MAFSSILELMILHTLKIYAFFSCLCVHHDYLVQTATCLAILWLMLIFVPRPSYLRSYLMIEKC